VLGSEYFFAHDMPEVLHAGNAIVPLADSRYVLLELAANSVPPMFDQPLYRAQLDGWIPIIAHPERNLVFQQRPDLLAELVRNGARTQVTAASLNGEFGREARAAAEAFLDRRLVHFIATDAHNATRRPPRIREASAALRARVGEEIADALLLENPRAVLENRPIPYDPEPLEPRKSGFFTRLRSFFEAR
jgi:protein-tyrosine phosphatase